MIGHRIGKSNIWVYTTKGRDSQDPEKCVLPTIIFINTTHPEYKRKYNGMSGFMLAFGWWDWNFKIAFYWRKKR